MAIPSQRILLTTFAAVAMAALAGAQVDLPRRKSGEATDREKSGGDADKPPPPAEPPRLVCTVCFERNLTTPPDPADEDGLQSAQCTVCRKVTIHQTSSVLRGESGDIVLPSTPDREGAAAEPAPATGATDSTEARRGAARHYFDALERSTRAEGRVVDQAVESLVLLGEEGTSAARLALLSESAAVFRAAAGVLLRSKDGADHDLVAQRLRSRVPTSAAGAAVDDLVRLDPVRATPAYLVSLLEHQQPQMRAAVEKHLRSRLGPELLPPLADALDAKIADARLRALELATRIDDPGVLELLLDRVADTSAHVAWRAVTALATWPDPRVEFELLSLAFQDRWILRTNAYALLALIEREDRTLAPILNEGHVDALLGGLTSNDPFVAGTCAAALAGIGFRSGALRDSAWLDREVPDKLVATVAGHVYFNDFSSLRGPAQRRLQDIAGVNHGADGPRWAEWWIDSRDGFRASRATLHVVAGDERGLEVRFRSGGADATVFRLLGPDRAVPSDEPVLGEPVYLTQAEAGEFVELLRREGMLSVQCLPGQRGDAARGRVLDIRVAGQSKLFAFGPEITEPWFDRAVGMARTLRERNRWQRYPDPSVHGDRLGLWRTRAEWWSAETDEHVRANELKRLVLAHLAAVPTIDWEPGIAELERLAFEHDVLALEDFLSLVKLLDAERFLTQRARRLLALAERAGGLTVASAPAAADPEAPAAVGAPAAADGSAAPDESATPAAPGRIERCDRLLDLLVHRFGPDAAEEIASLLARAGRERTRAAARDARSVLRAVAASVLARKPSEADVAVLLELLRDPSEEVEIAAVMALGEERIEAGRTELLVRARLGTPLVRAAALRAIGVLGGENVLDALTVALTDPDPELKLAAAEGLASLDDARATPMLVSLLRQGRDAPWYEAVRAGLRRQGAAAEEALRAMLRAPSLEMQREAALLLAARSVADAVPALLRVLDADKADRAVAEELAVLSCVDYRAAEEPAKSWITWWEGVVHDDASAWFRAALESRGWAAPSAQDLVPPGTRDVRMLLVEVLRRGEDYLAERARRELSSMLGRDLGAMPPPGSERDAWLAVVSDLVARSGG